MLLRHWFQLFLAVTMVTMIVRVMTLQNQIYESAYLHGNITHVNSTERYDGCSPMYRTET